ncbi:hypothetical protein [Novosphingobium sp. 9U]|uniref:hypothetical protein n=1 Tax=Novosphingobium sp. 9U TaxID=2653158 RepID=UPI0012EF1105|nr:hypothetical protein [Novosphingobium sp. 9U]VWX53940.1 conserved hypothetical protein [Novosphingobium sp. 9U]
MERLEAALSAQTVDMIKIAGDSIEFRPQSKDTADKPRPEGNGWMFNGLGACCLHVGHDQQGVLIDYNLDCRVGFFLVTVISVGFGALIQSSSGPDHGWGWAFACGNWVLMFFSSYISKTIEFRRWLKTNLTSHELPPTKRLRVPTNPD